VDGKAFEALPAKIVALQNLAIKLNDAHHGRDNFYTEPPVMQEILSYIKTSNDIPKGILPMLVPIVVSCRLGRGLDYHDGVSPAGLPLYDRFFSVLDDSGVIQCIHTMTGREFSFKLSNVICQKHLSSILLILKGVAIATRVRDAVEYMLADLTAVHRLQSDKAFREIVLPLFDGRQL
jgi:hypothetical protein